jgi:hypothetical protein
MDFPALDYQPSPHPRPRIPRWERITIRVQCTLSLTSIAAYPLSILAGNWVGKRSTRFVGDTAAAVNAIAGWGQLMALAGLAVGLFLLVTSRRKDRYQLPSYIALALCMVGLFLNQGIAAVA